MAKMEHISIFEIINRRGLREAASARHKALQKLAGHKSTYTDYCNECYSVVLEQYRQEEFLLKNGIVVNEG